MVMWTGSEPAPLSMSGRKLKWLMQTTTREIHNPLLCNRLYRQLHYLHRRWRQQPQWSMAHQTVIGICWDIITSHAFPLPFDAGWFFWKEKRASCQIQLWSNNGLLVQYLIWKPVLSPKPHYCISEILSTLQVKRKEKKRKLIITSMENG